VARGISAFVVIFAGAIESATDIVARADNVDNAAVYRGSIRKNVSRCAIPIKRVGMGHIFFVITSAHLGLRSEEIAPKCTFDMIVSGKLV